MELKLIKDDVENKSMAEEVGFEPTMGFHPCRFSRPVHSTALPPLRLNRAQYMVLPECD